MNPPYKFALCLKIILATSVDKHKDGCMLTFVDKQNRETSMPKVEPIKTRAPFATVFRCPLCGHAERGSKVIRYDCTRAVGRIRTHIANCTKVAA